MGALGQDAQNNIYVAQSAYSNTFNPFPGPYHPDYLSQNFQMPSDAVPFSTVEMLDTEVTTKEQRTTHSPPTLTHPRDIHLPPRTPAAHPWISRSFRPTASSDDRETHSGTHPCSLPIAHHSLSTHTPQCSPLKNNLFAIYLQPPKMLPTEDPNVHQQHQNQHQNYSGESFGTSQHEFYDSEVMDAAVEPGSDRDYRKQIMMHRTPPERVPASLAVSLMV
ncbi:hypothetical protein BU15DRAFT_81343 [Melanogaster broomeanus]|nr:hypothetical protein BU15DRAFT_81343 [Melanogaster broomeanus]